ncbi:glycoside hydrolase family 3 protein [Kutzneria chonburiensis]|uniref:Glycoside hydrolase family 3 C-terminal domain-containing protein n=1 Tax=Kutzneria chonburiensis TaxID=1483604 RepID=A0ABV6N6T3_9PSEU|nr:glycoside hydrolase family 3 protein [Kutzneria chonburiensis]
MDLERKIALTQPVQPPVPELGLPACELRLTVAVRGDLPPALALGSTWNPELAGRIGSYLAAGSGPLPLAPVGRPLQDPRRGPGRAAYAEDPLLCSRLGSAFTLGLRGPDPERIRTAPVIRKGVDALRCVTRPGFNMRLLNEHEWPALRATMETGGAVGVVLPWELFDEYPTVAHRLIKNVYRPWSDREIVVVCEVSGPEFDAAAALRLGADLCVGTGARSADLVAAHRRGDLSEETITEAARRVLLTRVRFDRRPEPVDGTELRALELEAARESVVLLHNDGLLPLLTGPGVRLAVIGSTGDTLARALGEKVNVLRHDGEDLEQAALVARSADVVVLMVGSRRRVERTTLALSDGQQRLLQAVRTANPNTVLVVSSSHPYALAWAAEHLPAMLWTAHDGPTAGTALAEVLLGDYAPTGRLPQTWYRTAEELPAELDGDIIATNITYLYHEDALFPFGHGLSYTTFTHGPVQLDTSAIDADGGTTVTVEVRNTGFRDCAEVVQLYTRQLASQVKQPRRQLRAFRRVWLPARATKHVVFRLRANDLAFWDVAAERWVIESAQHEVFTNTSSATAVLTVEGTSLPPRALADTTLGARSFDDASGVRLAELPCDRDSVITAVRPGGWAAYRGYDLTSCRTCDLSVTNTAQTTAAVELRLDTPDGPLLGTAHVPAGSSSPVAIPLRPRRGRHDLYLVFTELGLEVRTLDFRV